MIQTTPRDRAAPNFTNSASRLVSFNYGDNVTFDGISVITSVVLNTNNLTPSLATINGSQAYNFAGPGSITGFGGAD